MARFSSSGLDFSLNDDSSVLSLSLHTLVVPVFTRLTTKKKFNKPPQQNVPGLTAATTGASIMDDDIHWIPSSKANWNISDEGHVSEGQSPSPAAGHGVASSGLDNQGSSWISLLSVVSRPALAFLQKYLPVQPRNPALSENVAGWVSADLKQSFVEEGAFLGQLDDILPLPQRPATHLAYLRCQHDKTASIMEPRSGSTLHWLTADSLGELGIPDAAEVDMDSSQQTQIGYFSTARSFLGHILLSSASAQEIKHTVGGKDWPREPVSAPMKSCSVGRTWWGGFWGSEESSQSRLSPDLPGGKERTVTGHHCPKQPETGTKAAVPKTTNLFVQGSNSEPMPGENAGRSGHKEELADNGGLHTAQVQSVQRSERATAHHQPKIIISSHLIIGGAATACSEVALLTPDQDNGYSSLEEEHSHICQLYMVKDHCEEVPQQVTEWKGDSATMKTDIEGDISEEGKSTAVGVREVDEGEDVMEGFGIGSSEDDETPTLEGSSVVATVETAHRCQNKTIAYIMGIPCSDEDDSQSDRESSEDDDGFDSEGSSELSNSAYEDDDDDEDSDSDSEADSETERLWNSLCQSQDPYNPRNFTARLCTSSTTPRSIPATATASSCSTPASSPDQTPSPLSSSPASPPLTSSPPRSHDVWDDSTSASEVDEAESLLLWRSFSSSSDPYSPLNFQAPLRTCGPTEAGQRGRSKKTSQMPACSPHYTAASPPQYRKEEAEERLDSGFSEPLVSTVASSSTSTTLGFVTVKKVRFCDKVEEFFASCGEEEEDRRGPWEELARDRFRFLRRCQEVEQSIAYCLQPQHRSLVYQRLTVRYSQDG